MTCVEYLFGAIKNKYSKLEGNKAAPNSFGDRHCTYPSLYSPELDVANELYEESNVRFQQIIGVLRCSIELGRIDIMTDVSYFINIYDNLMRGTLMMSIGFEGTYRRIYKRIQE